jgi:hypothetical protein
MFEIMRTTEFMKDRKVCIDRRVKAKGKAVPVFDSTTCHEAVGGRGYILHES